MMIKAQCSFDIRHYLHGSFIRKTIFQQTIVIVPTNKDHCYITANRDQGNDIESQ